MVVRGFGQLRADIEKRRGGLRNNRGWGTEARRHGAAGGDELAVPGVCAVNSSSHRHPLDYREDHIVPRQQVPEPTVPMFRLPEMSEEQTLLVRTGT